MVALLAMEQKEISIIPNHIDMKNWTKYMSTVNTKHGIGLKGMKLDDEKIRHEVTKELKRRLKLTK